MRIYRRDEVCPFRFTREIWGEFSNFAPLAVPVDAGPWSFSTSEALYQAAKFGAAPDVQQRIAGAPTAREAAAIGRGTTAGLDPDWMAQRVNVMRWVLRMKREANAAAIDAALAATGARAIVEVSTRDAWWGAKPAGDTLRGHNVVGRLWMELRQQLRDGDPAARSAAWTGRIRVGRLADLPCT
ncbi:MAG: NADAR family protein [Rhodospirillaceae bacterium]|nr:NADAR family protein [Rhodospirillaceae bacterium]